jgi:cyclopropane fatty-acyl-phospholipid synthase-like methyltransferase
MPERNRFTGKMEPSIRDYDLSEVLDLVDRRFGIDTLMRDLTAPRDRLVAAYYKQSRKGYEHYHRDASMHYALCEGEDYDHDGLYAQARAVIALARRTGAKRILEIGCGQAFNARHVAQELPGVEVMGLDLMQDHADRANARAAEAGLTNFHAAQGSFTAFPQDAGQFDIIFAVETLCYADRDEIDSIAGHLFDHLAPGGHFMMHDGIRKADWDDYPRDLQTAHVLNELCMAVTNDFFSEGEWEAALVRAGFADITTEDLSQQTLGTVRRIARMGVLFTTRWKYRLMMRFVPKYLARNSVSGLLSIFALFGSAKEPDVRKGIVKYLLVTARKPA